MEGPELTHDNEHIEAIRVVVGGVHLQARRLGQYERYAALLTTVPEREERLLLRVENDAVSRDGLASS